MIQVPQSMMTTTATRPISTIVASSSCPVIHSMMLRRDGPNDRADVMRLQTFLRATEHADVDISGVFDGKTEEAVKAFQKKHADIALAPWDTTKASGVVFITTSKKINQIACGQALTLTADELATIRAYKTKVAAGMMDSDMTGVPLQSGKTSGGVSVGPRFEAPKEDAPDVNKSPHASTNAAAADSLDTSQSSMAKRFWYFLTHLF